jgi:hypothetical protein
MIKRAFVFMFVAGPVVSSMTAVAWDSEGHRAVNQLVAFKSIEAKAGERFTIPGEDISPRWDLMYYFELLSTTEGWFTPDPAKETPYYVVKVSSPTN